MLKWSSNWCLYFNTNNCNVLHSGEKTTDCDYFMCIVEVDYKLNNSQHIGWLARMSVLDTEVDGSNPGSSMLFP